MKKNFVIMLVLFVSLMFATSVMAADCPPGQVKKGWKCVPDESSDPGMTIVTVDSSSKNTNTNLNTNLNTNTNSNKNTNLNLNANIVDVDNEIDMDQKQHQKQDQKQVQAQDQKQIQGQNQSANNEGVSQTVIFEEAENKANHPSAAGPTVPDGQVDGAAKAFKAKVQGYNILERLGFITKKQAKALADGAPDAVVTPGLVFQGEPTSSISYGKAGKFMGYIYVTVDGLDAVATGVVGKAAESAMENGVTHMIPVYEGAEGKHLEGVSWGIGFGGQGSVASSSGDSIITPSTSTGYGKAKSRNELLPEGVYECYSTGILEVKKPQLRSGYNPIDH